MLGEPAREGASGISAETARLDCGCVLARGGAVTVSPVCIEVVARNVGGRSALRCRGSPMEYGLFDVGVWSVGKSSRVDAGLKLRGVEKRPIPSAAVPSGMRCRCIGAAIVLGGSSLT